MLVIGCLIAAACEKTPQDKPGDDPDDKPEVPAKEASVEVKIDGDFADWDAITEDAAGKDDYMAVVKAGAADPINVIKTSSDALNVYFYAEILAEALPQNSICSEWGDSWNGTPEKGYKGDDENDKVGETFNIFFDPDGNDKTGFYTYADANGDPAIPGLGCEMCCQNFMFYNPSLKKLCIAWNQTNIGPDKQTDENGAVVDFDYNGTIFQAEWPDNVIPQWGWQNGSGDGTGDNIAPKPENIKSVVSGKIIKVEFAIEKSDIVNLEDDATQFAWGICFRNGADYSQDIGPIRAMYSE